MPSRVHVRFTQSSYRGTSIGEQSRTLGIPNPSLDLQGNSSSGIQWFQSEVNAMLNTISELEILIAELEHLRIVQADFNSIEVVLAKTKIRETLLRIYGVESSEYQDNLGSEIFPRDFSRIGLTRDEIQAAFLEALPHAVEKYRLMLKALKGQPVDP